MGKNFANIIQNFLESLTIYILAIIIGVIGLAIIIVTLTMGGILLVIIIAIITIYLICALIINLFK